MVLSEGRRSLPEADDPQVGVEGSLPGLPGSRRDPVASERWGAGWHPVGGWWARSALREVGADAGALALRLCHLPRLGALSIVFHPQILEVAGSVSVSILFSGLY